MTHARRLLIGTLIAAVGAQTACVAHAKTGYTRYRNVAYGVAIDAPEGWTVSSHVDGSVLTLHLKRPDSELHAEDCDFFITKSPETLRQSQAEINRDYRGDQNHLSVRFLLMQIPGGPATEIKFIKQHGRATLFSEATGGTSEEAFRFYQVSFGVPGRSFDGSCRARPEHYAQQRPVYEHILRSLSPIE